MRMRRMLKADSLVPCVVADDSEAAENMFERDPSLPAGESAEEETEDSIMSPIPVGPPSPLPNDQDFTPKEGSPYEVPVYIPDDIPIPGDLELRESSVPGTGLGIWAKVKIRLGERFGPYSGTQSAAVKETTFGWERSPPRRLIQSARLFNPPPGAGGGTFSQLPVSSGTVKSDALALGPWEGRC
ncbi:hypothetical protein COCON_G00140420 [Conger conger]|uniref:PR domain zinc finger protein 16 n=1 Tax=Conger conger TaxID=82655 RepID=A0A9Q1DAQ6_CONCO|nr:hypothetical protein COCON_G00140420 [Conger conger]